MNWMKMARMLEAIDGESPTRLVTLLSEELKEMKKVSDKQNFLQILDKDNLKANGMALTKTKKWLAKAFDVHTDEIEAMYMAHDDLGDAIYYFDVSSETTGTLLGFTLNVLKTHLEMPFSKIESDEFRTFQWLMESMASLERKWFIRYLLRTPRNGINTGIITKAIARTYGYKVSEVKKHLITSSVGDVILYYEMGETPKATLSHGSYVAPMLAKDVPMNKWPKNKIVDYKYDGNRYQIHKEGESVIIFNRKGKVVTKQFPDVVEVVSEYPNGIYDGEIYPINEDGSPAEHKKMGTRVHSKNVQEAMEKVEVKWVMFDCLKIEGRTIIHLPYSERLALFGELPDQALRMKKGEDVLAFYNRAINDGFEGIIVKDADLPYQAGSRSVGWAKYKPPRIELDVVILKAKYGQGAKANVFATFEIFVKDGRGFYSVGWVGTGFSDNDLYRLTQSLRKNVVDYTDGIYEFTPRVVLEVTADLITQDANAHTGLRFPRCKRIRDDKFVNDINTLDDVEAMR